MTTATPGAGSVVTSDYWKHTYDRRLHPVQGNAQVLALTQRSDGSIQTFDHNGRQLENHSGAGATLQNLPGGDWKLTLADRTVENYSAAGRLESIVAPNGQVTVLSYENGLLDSVTGPFGHRLQIQYDADGQIESLQLPNNGTIQYTYDGQKRPTVVTYADGTTRRYHYERPYDPWLLTGITDENQQRYSTYTYDDAGRVQVSQHTGADRYEFTYNANNTVIKDPLQTSRTYGFVNANGLLKTASLSAPGEACGTIKASTYDAAGNASVRKDFNNNETHYEYDQARNLEVSRIEAFGTDKARTITTTWHPTFRLPAEVVEPGKASSYTYDAQGNLLTRSVTDSETSVTRTWTYTYNTVGQVLTIDGPRSDASDVTTYTYHSCNSGYACGQVDTITDAAGNQTTYLIYNAHGQPLQVEDPNGAVTTFTYDQRQRITSVSHDGELTEYEYWPTGLLKSVKQPDGSTLTYGYDAAHRLTSIVDGEGNRIDYTLDAAGNRVGEELRDPSNELTKKLTRVFDSAGRLASESGSAGQTVVFGTDALGNIVLVRDPLGRETVQGYDSLNRLSYRADPMGGLTEFGYDPSDRLTSVTDPNGLTTSYDFDGFGDLTAQTSPDTGLTEFEFDPAGTQTSKKDARNRLAEYEYDAAGRVTEIEYSDQTIGFTYDTGVNTRGRLARVNDASGSTSWAYDLKGRATQKTHTVGSVVLSVGYQHNSAGRLQSMTTPSGQVVTYSYSNGQLVGISVNGSSLLGSALYSPFGPTRGWQWANGTYTVREYDLDGRVTMIDSAGVATYTYNDDGTIASRSDDAASTAFGPAGLTTFDVAANSNRLNSSTGVQNQVFSYDAAGNLIGDGTRSFTYNDAGRMVSATANGVTTQYAYNAIGQRVRKSSSTSTTHYAYDEAGHLLGEYDGTGQIIQELVWLHDIPVALLRKTQSGTVGMFYVHANHLNTPVKVTRPDDNSLIWRWDHEPFGVGAPNADPDGNLAHLILNLRFPGQFYDDETGLNYNYFRDYDSSTGRYVQSDPIGLNGGQLNTYAYVASQPLRFSDPLGLWLPAMHRRMSQEAAAKSCPKIAAELGCLTAGVDALENSQLPVNSFWHAMSDGRSGQSSDEALAQFDEYVARNAASCDLGELARALHAVQDSFSPAHRGFKSWSGFRGTNPFRLMWHGLQDTFANPGTYDQAIAASASIVAAAAAQCNCLCGT